MAATPAPGATSTVVPMLDKKQLKEWLGVSEWTVKGYLKDPTFVKRCVVDVAAPGSSRKAYRFDRAEVAAYLERRLSTEAAA